jgi:hypothetical protein
MPTYSEDMLIIALTAYCNSEYPLIQKCAYVFNIPIITLLKQLSTQTSCNKSYESQQILLTTKEKALIKAITRLSNLGCPITLLLIRDLAKEIRLSCFYLSSTLTSYSPISKQWIDRF